MRPAPIERRGDTEARRYHLEQYEKPYDSTIALEQFIRAHAGQPAGVLMDVGCGAGAVLDYFNATGLTEMCGSIGVDADPELLKIANEHHDSWSWMLGDFNDPLPKCAVSVSVQVLSFIEDWRNPIRRQLEATREWAFVTSLFWRGVGAHIHASDREKRDAHYNIIEQGEFEDACAGAGAKRVIWQPYAPPRALHAPEDVLRSRTVGVDMVGVTFSGPLLLPWWMVAVRMTEEG